MEIFRRDYRAIAAVLIVTMLALALNVFYPQKAEAVGNTKIRQEINIIDGYMYAGSGSFATSSAIVQTAASSTYPGNTAYLEVVASTTAATAATVTLVNATSSASTTSITINGGNTYTRYRSNSFTLPDAATEWQVRLNNEATGKGIIAARIIILQDTASLTSTETQIELGSATTSANNTATLPLTDTKYWYYNSAGWDASPTFYVEATYKMNPVASTTLFKVTSTTTSRFISYTPTAGTGYITVEAWGAGGGGDGATSAATIGGGGGAGGAYARSTTTPGTTGVIGIGGGGAEGVATAASTTYTGSNGNIVRAAGGIGANSATGGATTTSDQSIGTVIFNGGGGGNGETTADTGGGGGGAAGPDGDGKQGGTAAANGPGGTGGNGDNNSGGAGGAGGNGGDDTCDTEIGRPGVSNALGGGGGGGADGDVSSVCVGGSGGAPGGGGGGSDEGVAEHLGGPGQLKLTEYVGTVGIALQEDDGNFGSWTLKQQLIVAGAISTTTARIRGASFTPTNGKHYRLVASTTNSTASYDIYNAKVVVVQTTVLKTLIDSFYTAESETQLCADCSTQGVGQTFAPSQTGILDSVIYRLRKTNSPTGSAVASIYAITGTPGSNAIPSGPALATSDTLDVSTLSAAAASTTLTFSGANRITLTASTDYFVSLEYLGSSNSPNIINGNDDFSSPTDGGNYAQLSGSTWTAFSSIDLQFYLNSMVTNGSVTLLEPQYLLAPFKLPTGTGLQNFLTSFDTSEWSTTNNYLHAVSAIDNSTSTIEIDDTTGPTQITGSVVTSPDNYATSTDMCLTSTATLDTKATANNNDIFSDSIIVQVGVISTASCGGGGGAAGTPARINIINGQFILNNGRLDIQ